MINEEPSNQQRLVVKLEENAMDSLVHGVEHHLYGRRNTDWKYVILHVSHAVELFLKARLAKHCESLIYDNEKNGKTVGFDEAIDRLVKKVKLPLFQYRELQKPGKYKLDGVLDALREARNSIEHIEHKEISLTLSEVQEFLEVIDRLVKKIKLLLLEYGELQKPGKYKLGGALNALRKARNSIEHKEISLTPSEVQEFLGAAFGFLDTFLTEELDLSLKTELDNLDKARKEELFENEVEFDDLAYRSTYQTLSMAYLFYIQHMETEGIPISDPREKYIDFDYFTCDSCDKEAIAVPDPTAKYPRITHCFNCLAEYTVYYCPSCNQPYVSFLREWEKEVNLSIYPSWVNSGDNEIDSFCELCSDR